MYRLAIYVQAFPGYYTCCNRGIVSNEDVNKDLILENIYLFITNHLDLSVH